MKRTRSINLDRMRKTPALGRVKPLVSAIAAITLAACGAPPQEAKIYASVADCLRENPGLKQECESAYQQALAQASKSGPKYRRQQDCIEEFGPNNCVAYRGSTGQSWFMPAMAGYLFARAMDGRGFYQSAPLYTSYSRYSPVYGQWSSVDGQLLGRKRYGKTHISQRAFQPKPAVTRTISRGGFGSTVAAKANWGGSSHRVSRSGGRYRGGWGG